MVEHVDDFDIVLVDSEMEALALELNLIKRYRPKYNILLKDDKHFPYIRVDLAQDYPRLELVRRQARDGARYFGPYKGATAVREVLDVARMVFPIRTCNRVIRPEKPQRPCVHHEIGQCLAPCAGLTTPRGIPRRACPGPWNSSPARDGPVLAELKERMAEAAKAMNYERAAVYRDRIRAVEDVMQRQKAISTHESDQDVIAVVPEETDAVIQMLFIRSRPPHRLGTLRARGRRLRSRPARSSSSSSSSITTRRTCPRRNCCSPPSRPSATCWNSS